MGFIFKIASKRFDYFNGTTITLRYDSLVSTFTVKTYFDPENAEHKALFKPLTYPTAKIETEEGERLLSGTIINYEFADRPTEELTALTGYSRCSVLNDCPIPVDQYPLEYNGLSLFQIAEKLCKPFFIDVVKGNGSAAVDEVYEEIAAKENEPIGVFLSRLAAQKGLIVTHTPFSNIQFEVINLKTSPKGFFEGGTPGVEMTASIKGQSMHSEITVKKQAALGTDNAAQASIVNPFVGVYRPMAKTQSAGTGTNSTAAARKELGNELKNLVFRISLKQWTWPGTSEIIKPNNLVSAVSPKCYLFNPTTLFVKEAVLSLDPEKGETAQLICVLPEAFSDTTVKNIF